MKKAINWKVLAAIFIVPVLFSCSVPTASGGKATAGTTGTVKISVPRISPTVQNALARLTGTTAAARAASSIARAYTVADRVVFTLYAADGTVADSWEDTPSQIVNDEGALEDVRGIAVGTGYTVKVEIFDNLASTTTPTTSGTSASFAIQKDAVTKVSISCIPTDAESLAYGTIVTGTLQKYWAYGTDTLLTGSTAWYGFTTPSCASGQSVAADLILVPDDATASEEQFLEGTLYDATGKSLDGCSNYGVFDLQPNTTYYLSLIGMNPSGQQGTATYSLTVRDSVSSAALPAPANQAISDVTATTATLGWDAVTQNAAGATISGVTYRVYYQAGTAGAVLSYTGNWNCKSSHVTGTSTTLSGLVANTTYLWKVVACSSDGMGSSLANSVTGTFTTAAASE